MRTLFFYAVALVLAAASFVMVFPAHAAGERITSAELKRALETDTGEFPRGFAIGFIAGIFDATVGAYHCTPPTVKTDEILRIAIAGLLMKVEPGSKPQTADVPIIQAFVAAYPCGRGPDERPRNGDKT